MARPPSARPSATEPAQPSVTEPAVLVGIVIMVDHVYLPLDAEGNARAEWRGAIDTIKVVKKTQLKVPQDLADFLADRDQAVIVR